MIDVEIPVLDWSRFTSDKDKEGFVADLSRACRDTGFFLVTGHGIPQSLIDETFAVADRFFALPFEEKAKLDIRKIGNNRGWSGPGTENLDDTKPNQVDQKEAFNTGLEFAQWPRLSREAFLDPSISFDARLAGALFGWIMVMPLVLYALAMIVQLVLRAFGTTGAGYQSRIALFWALLASTPLWLLTGLTAGFVGPGPGLTITGIAALGAFIVFWLAGLSVIMGQRDEGRA